MVSDFLQKVEVKMPKYTVDALRVIRSMQQSHEIAGHGPMAERMREVGDQVERMAEELRMRASALRAKDADYVALREAAGSATRAAQTIIGVRAYAIPKDKIDNLARLCGEE